MQSLITIAPQYNTMREQFEIKIEVLDCVNDETAIATASAYLAYADTTDTFGYAPTIDDAYTHSDGDGPLSVTIKTRVELANDAALQRFKEELDTLAKVIDYTSMGYV